MVVYTAILLYAFFWGVVKNNETGTQDILSTNLFKLVPFDTFGAIGDH